MFNYTIPDFDIFVYAVSPVSVYLWQPVRKVVKVTRLCDSC